MCRWIAYCGEEVQLDTYVTSPAHSLVSLSYNAFEGSCRTNGDGFGIGWYGAGHRDPGLYKETRPAWSDENLRHLCRHLRSHLFFAHVRAATGTATTRPNCHPFACGEWMFMHNGYIGDWPNVRREVEALIPDELYSHRNGTTDSEAIFLAIAGAGLSRDPVGAVNTTLERIARILNGRPLRFTAALANGTDVYAFSYAANDASNSLYYRPDGAGHLLASEPIDHQRDTWSAVPNNTVLCATPHKAVVIRELEIGTLEKRVAA